MGSSPADEAPRRAAYPPGDPRAFDQPQPGYEPRTGPQRQPDADAGRAAPPQRRDADTGQQRAPGTQPPPNQGPPSQGPPNQGPPNQGPPNQGPMNPPYLDRPPTGPGSGPAQAPGGPPSGMPPSGAPAGAPGPRQHSRAGAAWVAFIVAAVVLIFLLIFILQNSAQVGVFYLGLEGQLPLGVAMMFAALAGALTVGLLGTVRILQLRARARRGGEAGGRSVSRSG